VIKFQIKSLSSSTATTLISVTDGSGSVYIEDAKFTTNGTAVSMNAATRDISIMSLWVSRSNEAIRVSAANHVFVSNLACEQVDQCILVQDANSLRVENSDILGPSIGNGITFNSVNGDVSIEKVFIKDALLDGLNVEAAKNVVIRGSKFLSNGQSGVSVDECDMISMEDVLAGSNGGNGVVVNCTDVSDDVVLRKIASLSNGGTDIGVSLTLQDSNDAIVLDNIVACDSGNQGVDSNGSIALSLSEDQLSATDITADGCSLNDDGTCAAIADELSSCEAFCADPPSSSSSLDV
jgi:Right handed beta helix region